MPTQSDKERRAARLMRASPVRVGEVVGGKYQVEAALGGGGMGVVVAAVHLSLGQRVAIKFLRESLEDEHAAARFLREARVAARIQSEHVARVFDCGTTDGGAVYMVMEYLEGVDLASELKARGRLPIPEAVDVLLEAIDGIASAHALGIVHRDVKPGNLFLASTGYGGGVGRAVKVLDFGISKLEARLAAADDAITATSTMLGSPRYMSPEQAQNSKGVDARSDIWSLGVVLYEALDGACPFAADSMGGTIGRVLTVEPRSLHEQHPEVPEALSSVVERCLQRDRERRFRNVAELASALAPFGSGRALASIERVTSLAASGKLDPGASAAVEAPPAPAELPVAPPPVAPGDPDLTVRYPPALMAVVAHESTRQGWSQSEIPARPRRGKKSVAIVGGLVAAATILAGAALFVRHGPAAPATDASSAPVTAPEQASPAPSASIAVPGPAPSTPVTVPTPAPSASPVASLLLPAAKPPPVAPPGKSPARGKGGVRKDILGSSD